MAFYKSYLNILKVFKYLNFFLFHQFFKLTPFPSLKLSVNTLIQSTVHQTALAKLQNMTRIPIEMLRQKPIFLTDGLSISMQIDVQQPKHMPNIKNRPEISLKDPATK